MNQEIGKTRAAFYFLEFEVRKHERITDCTVNKCRKYALFCDYFYAVNQKHFLTLPKLPTAKETTQGVPCLVFRRTWFQGPPVYFKFPTGSLPTDWCLCQHVVRISPLN